MISRDQPSVPVRPPQGLHDSQECVHCGAMRPAWRIPWGTGTRLVWKPCACQDTMIEERIQQRALRLREARQLLDARQHREVVRDDGTTPLSVFRDQDMTLDQFRREWLTHGQDVAHPLDVVRHWIDTSMAYGDHANYTDADSPPAMLFLYNRVNGVGKTHLAAGAALVADALDRHVVCTCEDEFLRAYWGSSLHEQSQLLARLAQYPWLTIIDDLGSKGVSRRGEEQSTIADAWDAMLGQRYRTQGWTIVTSNFLPSQLEARGTITPRALSRLAQMVGETGVVFVDGSDRRIR